ncbi:MAG: S8 family serine peptidase [Dehalococcoidia bacterium]|nr:S8 family serine peptidase [Dehalococcoidia bacterium]
MASFFALLLASAFAVQKDSGAIAARPASPVVPGRYIVVLQPGVDAASVAIGHGAIPEQAYSHALSGFAGQLSPRQVGALRADARVLSIEADQVVSIADQATPTGIQRIFAPGNGAIDIDGADDWRVDVDVAVIDTGIDAGHPDLNVVNSANCSGGAPWKSSCGSGGSDDNGHGTHVAGTIGALDNGIGVVGVAPGARLWSVKVLNSQGSGYMSWIVAGIDYVAANAASIEVANMSLGCECASAAMNTAISNAVSEGVVFVVAAGNNGKDAGTFSPANHPDVITVSALADFDGLPGGLGSPTCWTDQDDTLADFSNYGASVEIAAPGVCILSTVPGGYATYSGTSMASPHVAGAAALLASMSKPANKTQALAVRSALIGAGNLNWTDDSNDGFKEPLLDVSNTTVFNPVMVPGSGGGGGNAAPTANNVSVSTDAGAAAIVALSGSDAETCDLTFSIVTGPANGTLSGITSNGCTPGTPNTDSATVTYTPNANFSGSDSFTYMVNDGSADSPTATVSVTVNAPSGEHPTMSATLAGSAVAGKGAWAAIVTASVTSGGTAVNGATVTGVWNGGGTPVSCVTDSSGHCAVQKNSSKKVGSVTFQVTGVALSGYTYDDANPSVVISKP